MNNDAAKNQYRIECEDFASNAIQELTCEVFDGHSYKPKSSEWISRNSLEEKIRKEQETAQMIRVRAIINRFDLKQDVTKVVLRNKTASEIAELINNNLIFQLADGMCRKKYPNN